MRVGWELGQELPSRQDTVQDNTTRLKAKELKLGETGLSLEILLG